MTITYTNDLGMPAALAKAVELDTKHTAGDISVTQLIDPPRIRQLIERHDVTVDVSESLWALMGKSCHKAIEEHVSQSEVQLVGEVDGVRVSGTIDEIDGGTLRDWKMTSVWTFVFQGDKGRLEWEKQLNLYAWLCENAEHYVNLAMGHLKDNPDAKYSRHEIHRPWPTRKVTALRACMIFRDWQKSKVNSKNYPQQPWHEAEIPLWTPEQRDVAIRHLVSVHKAAEALPDKDLPLCEPEDRWVNERTGKEIRCLDYCAARSVCDHALALKALST